MRAAVCLLLVLGWAGGRPLSAQVPPDAEWHALDTPHFRVTFMAGLESVAREAAARAEAAYVLLSREVVEPPRGRIELVIADNVDFANGYATPLPTNRIVVYAHPPADNPDLSFTTDWLNLVVLHELVHIFHLDHAGGIWDRLRSILGRNALLFPQVYLPGWVVEGLATYYESRLTPGGRVRGTLFDMALRTAILEDAFFPIDRATGDPSTWPGGSTRYIYGALFVDFLARHYGAERVPEFIDRYGSGLPFHPDAVAKRSFGATLTRAWSLWEDSLRAHYAGVATAVAARGLTEPEILTPEGRTAAFPRYAPAGGALAYASATGREPNQTRLILPDGSVRVLQERNTPGPAAWTPDGSALLHAQLDFTDPYRIYSDLYLLGTGGEVERLTRAARLLEPDLHPEGGRVVAVQNAGASNVLVLHDLRTGDTRPLTAALPDEHWALPRWSPGGDRIAASRWSRGGLYDVVVLDSTGAVMRELTRDRATDAAPAWSPDGRYVVFASDRTGIPNLFAYDLQADRLLQVTNLLTGAAQPDVSPDGRWIAFSYYRSDGYHVARIPFDPAAWRAAPAVRAAAAPLDSLERFPPTGGKARRYSPWRSLAPAAWTPVVEGGSALGVGIGAGAGGRDVVDRHAWAVGGIAYPEGGRFSGAGVYRYRGLGRPVLDVSGQQEWRVSSASAVDTAGEPIASAILRRDRDLRASLFWDHPRWRWGSWLRTGVELNDLDFAWEDVGAAGGRGLRRYPLDAGATVEAGYRSTRGAAFSLGPQQGVTAALAAEGHRYLAPLAGEEGARGYLRFTGRGRGYRGLPLPGFARHVAALRVDLGAETGSVSPGFSVGGASGGALPLAVDLDILGGGLAFPLRGYAEGVQIGNRALSGTAEYRFPLLLVERGYRVFPFFLERAWGDVFVDAGTAWCTAGCEGRFTRASDRPELLYSVGAEAVLDLQVSYWASLPLRAGVALPLRGPGASQPTFYLRVGRSF